MRRRRHAVPTAALIAILLTMQTAAAQVSLTITSVVTGADGETLAIRGTNMCAAPSVTLGGAPQTVTSADATLVTIAYPDVEPGSYRLTVSCGAQSGRTASFDVEIRQRQAGR